MKTDATPEQDMQWMIAVGVGEDDVAWLKSMAGTVESHMDGNRIRMEAIYTAAIERLLASAGPIALLRHALN
jgi:hypothetical protein